MNPFDPHEHYTEDEEREFIELWEELREVLRREEEEEIRADLYYSHVDQDM